MLETRRYCCWVVRSQIPLRTVVDEGGNVRWKTSLAQVLWTAPGGHHPPPRAVLLELITHSGCSGGGVVWSHNLINLFFPSGKGVVAF